MQLCNFKIYGPYSVRMREKTDQKNSEYGHFSRCDCSYKAYILHNIALAFLNLSNYKNLLRFEFWIFSGYSKVLRNLVHDLLILCIVCS